MTLTETIARARAYAPFLATLLDRERAIAEDPDYFLADPFNRIAAAEDQPLAARLRIERRRLALVVALGDLSGRYDLTRVTRLLSDFADTALDRAIAAAIQERTPGAPVQGFAAIALGKQGSRELNYSSDIDPILIYDPETLPLRPREEAGEAAVRIGRRVVELLQARDGDGYVLRVDLRLRPAPEVTPIALPVDAAISHYESQAEAWERAAFIRSRAAAGDLALGERFLAAIRPFVWRRGLDFGAIAELRAMTHKIRDHHSHGQSFGPGYDLKRGRGGIREVEFFAQIHQLIHGGRDPALRLPATRDALAALAEAGRISAGDAEALTQAYTLLRTIEHRVQMIDDRQTHVLPPEADALDRVARLHGLDSGAELVALLRPHVEGVNRRYDSLDSEEREQADLSLLPTEASRLIEGWRGGIYPALRSVTARTALEALLPGLCRAFVEAPDPMQAVIRLDAILARLPSAVNFLRLLEARPPLVRLLSAILCLAPTLAEDLTRRVELLDGLIDASAFDPVGTVAALAGEMRRGESGDDYQALLDHVRQIVGEKRFALGAQIVAGAGDPLEAPAGYARVAEAALVVLAEATVSEFARRHGRVPDGELVVLALGRLGGEALTHASDLDLVYLFTGDYQGESDGDKPLGAMTYYNRLAQRISAALSVPTASGPLYDVDTRLRPSGTQGPLVVSIEGFRRYQQEDAWTWEHMALTRARPVFGSVAGRAEVQAVIDAVLAGARPDRDIAADAAAMRADMARHKPPHGPLDVKLPEGGLVDLEFAVHVTQLVHRTGFDPHLPVAVAQLTAAGLLPPTLEPALALLSRLLVTMRLVAPDAQLPPPPIQELITRALGMADWEAVLTALDRARQEVAACWAMVREGRTAW